jgi:NADPH:quinone reductase
MTAYQMLHRTARVTRGETLLMHGAAGRVGTAALELGAVAGLRMIGTASARDREVVERLGATWIDYQNEDFLARVRELTSGGGVDVVLDGIGGKVALRSFRALRKGDWITGDPGGRLVTMGAYNTLVAGHKSRRAWLEWWPAMTMTWIWGFLSTRRRVSGYRIQILRIPHQDWFQEDFGVLLELLRNGQIHPLVAGRLPFAEARHAHELLESSAAKGKLVLVP